MKNTMNLNLEDDFVRNLRETLPEPDVMLGKGSMIPFNDTNSGARKILSGTQREHVIPIENGEVAYIMTGTEQLFGEYSSSIDMVNKDTQVIAKIPKFALHPDHHYFLILLNSDGILDIKERKCYKHITESYGYTVNTSTIDALQPNDRVREGTILQKSDCYDEFNNRKDGINALAVYMSLGQVEEDGIVISKSFQKKVVSPLVHKVSIVANNNDIPLNLFGNTDPNGIYKVMPDILESVPEGLLAATRRENKEETLYSQSYIRLKDIMMSDDKYTTNGTVVDINVYCNNPEYITDNPYYAQIKYYYDQDMQFCQNLVNVVNSLGGVYRLSYELNKMYCTCSSKLSNTQFIKDRPFSNVIIDITLIERNMISVGDKIADRFGGKGVVVAIWDDERMPMISNGRIADVIINKSTCVNRLNPGQCYETEYNHIAQHLISAMGENYRRNQDPDACMEYMYKFFRHTNPALEVFTRDYYDTLDEHDKHLYVLDTMQRDGIYQSYRPISDSSNLMKLEALYDEFPWITQYDVYVAQQDSNGTWRRVKARRPITCGTKFMYRLKQYAEEKFSATSLSPTNIKGENSKSRANKLYRDPYTRTPVRFGEMESGNFGHMGFVETITGLMIYSASPHARCSSGEQLLTGDPFNIDVKLDKFSTNVSVQILNTKFKTIGLRLRFAKKRIKLKPAFLKRGLIKVEPWEMPKSPLLRGFFDIGHEPTEEDYEHAHKIIDDFENHNGTGLKKPFIKLGLYHENYKSFEEIGKDD